MMVPLVEILAEVYHVVTGSKQVMEEYRRLTDLWGGEFKILLEVSKDQLRSGGGDGLAEAIEKVRRQEIVIDPGYDGEFGKVKIWPQEAEAISAKGEQIGLF